MGDEVDLGAIEDGFVAVAGSYSERQGISYAAWREVGVPAVRAQAGRHQPLGVVGRRLGWHRARR